MKCHHTPCGNEFTPHPRATVPQRYCSRACQIDHNHGTERKALLVPLELYRRLSAEAAGEQITVHELATELLTMELAT